MTSTRNRLDDLTPDQRREMLKKLLAERAQRDKIDFEAEASIDLELARQAVDPGRAVEPQRIFLTGGTGFVGAFALRRLLDGTEAEIDCLVRAENEAAAMDRIRNNMSSYEVWREGDEGRLRPIPGDLTKPALGLDENQLDELGNEADVIYHIAAIVNLAFKYALLKPSNVHGTREIVKLAARGRVKPLHYLSSYALFDSIQNVDRTFAEQDEPVNPVGLSNGYCESKWVAEKVVRNARAAGLPVAIYRVGWVVGHSGSGAWNKSDFIPRLIRSCIEVGKVCELGTMTMTPVDFLTDAYIHLSRQPESLGDIFHLSNGERYTSRQLFEWVTGFGYELADVPYRDWEAAMTTSTQELSLAPMLAFLADTAAGEESLKLSDWFSREPRIDASYTLQKLRAAGIECPRMGPDLMATYLNHFIDSGYLEPPAAVTSPAAGESSPPGRGR